MTDLPMAPEKKRSSWTGALLIAVACVPCCIGLFVPLVAAGGGATAFFLAYRGQLIAAGILAVAAAALVVWRIRRRHA